MTHAGSGTTASIDTAAARSERLESLLFRAAFLSGGAALGCWEEWKRQTNLDDHVDLGSFRLLPRALRNLREHGVEDSLFPRLAGVARKHWLANRVFFRDLVPPIRSLQAAGIDVIIPPGTALALVHYPDHPLDAILNSALIVPASRVLDAFGQFELAGWRATPPVPKVHLASYVRARSSHPFRDSMGRRFRLQWHVLLECPHRAADEACWRGARPAEVDGMNVSILEPPHQVLVSCCETVGLRRIPIFLRAVDTMLYLRAHEGSIDWQQFLEEAARPGVTLPVVRTLQRLDQLVSEAVPASVLGELRSLPVPARDRVEQAARARSTGWVSDAAGLWYRYRRSENASWLGSVLRFPRFLQHYLKLDHVWSVPGHAAGRVASRLTGAD